MLGNIEEENLIYLSDYEKKFVLGKASQEETTGSPVYSRTDNEEMNLNQKRNAGFIDTDKIPSIRLFRMLKKNTSTNPQQPFSNYPLFNHIERKNLISETFSTNHLFSSVLESVSAIPNPKQIRTANNRKKNAVDAILLYDTKFNHDNEIEKKAKIRTKEKVKEKLIQKEREMKSGSSTSKSFRNSVEELGEKSRSDEDKNVSKNLKSKSVHFIDDDYVVSESPESKTSKGKENFSSLKDSTDVDQETDELIFKPIGNEKLYNKFKRTKKLASDSKDKNESGKNKVTLIFLH